MRSQNEIVKDLASKIGCTITQAKKFVATFAEIIAGDLQTYGVINIAQIGRFTEHIRAAHKGRNPKTGAEVHVPAQTRILFKPKKKLLDKISSTKNSVKKNLP